MVATDLAALGGPVSGRWQLPLHLDASARTVYDFADPDEREEAYQLVLSEAASPADLEQWLDGTELLRMCPSCTCRGSWGPPGRPSSRT